MGKICRSPAKMAGLAGPFAPCTTRGGHVLRRFYVWNVLRRLAHAGACPTSALTVR
jgi:hypothetical protein